MSTLSVTTVCFILLLACFQPWTLADLHPNLQPQIQKQFSSEACEPPCAHCKLPSLPWKLLKPFCVMSGLTVISGGVYWELPLLLLFIVMRQIAGKQAPARLLQAWEAGSREAGWGCLARPLMELDKPQAAAQTSQPHVWTKDKCQRNQSHFPSLKEITVTFHMTADPVSSLFCFFWNKLFKFNYTIFWDWSLWPVVIYI